MIRVIDFQKVDMTDDEFAYYQELLKKYKEDQIDFFQGLFVTSKSGTITLIKPSTALPWEILFFVQNLMINQHLRNFDLRISKLEGQKDVWYFTIK